MVFGEPRGIDVGDCVLCESSDNGWSTSFKTGQGECRKGEIRGETIILDNKFTEGFLCVPFRDFNWVRVSKPVILSL